MNEKILLVKLPPANLRWKHDFIYLIMRKLHNVYKEQQCTYAVIRNFEE